MTTQSSLDRRKHLQLGIANRRLPMGAVGWILATVIGLVLAGCSASVEPVKGGAEPPRDAAAPGTGAASVSAPSRPVAEVCDHPVAGPAKPPPGAVVVDPAIDEDTWIKTKKNPPGTTFWLAPGVHTLTKSEYGQISPKDGNTYLGAPGAILDGRGRNLYAFVFKSKNVTIRYLTIRGFVPPVNEGVVNHDSGDGWVIENNIIENNRGGALMTGSRAVVRKNCLRKNGQYGINAGGHHVLVEGNEIVGNNADDLEHTLPGGCGCTGGAKFWDVDGADVRGNWVHDNDGVGLWVDTNNNDFLVENNVIENNSGEAFMYETSYNLVLRNNLIRGNTYHSGREFADRDDNFPVAAIYISEAGGDPRVPARTDKIEIYGNVLENNWSGITAWENADRYCNSPANTSGGYCTRVVRKVSSCSAPAIKHPPLYDDCRWKTQRLDIHDNRFIYSPKVVGCSNGMAGRMAVFSNYGTVPKWSPYKGRAVQEAITFHQDNIWHNNSYVGPWTFVAYETGSGFSYVKWRAKPYLQDTGSSFADISAPRC